MKKFFRRFAGDLRRRRNLDAYAIGSVAFAIAMLTVLGDLLPDQAKWAVVLAGVGLLVLRLTVPESGAGAGGGIGFGDRSRFDEMPLTERLRTTREVNIFAPSAVNVLNEQFSELLRNEVLGRRNGRVRIVVLDQTETAAVDLAVRQLDDSLKFKRRDFRADLAAVTEELHRMARWDVPGFDYRFLGYNPGFSLVALDPGSPDGTVIVELHGFHNESTGKRMHLELSHEQTPHWYSYWCAQFEHIWAKARRPEAGPAAQDG